MAKKVKQPECLATGDHTLENGVCIECGQTTIGVTNG